LLVSGVKFGVFKLSCKSLYHIVVASHRQESKSNSNVVAVPVECMIQRCIDVSVDSEQILY
jgi:hypothetical protein